MTNSFVNSVIPIFPPTEAEVNEALTLLGMTPDTVVCSYCGDPHTEWDHLRPVVKGRRPTGFVSEIANLVPACGKCNQSKGASEWESWMRGPARLSPMQRGVSDIEDRIRRLRAFASWREPICVDFGLVAGTELWSRHWANHERLMELMQECQTTAAEIRLAVQRSYLRDSGNGRDPDSVSGVNLPAEGPQTEFPEPGRLISPGT